MSYYGIDGQTAQALYSAGTPDRKIYLDRAEECAQVTIPHLVRPDGATQTTQYPTPYQSVGSRGVIHLATKLQQTLFPVNEPMFRLDIDDYALAEIAEEGEEARAKVDEQLSKMERTVTRAIEADANRSRLNNTLTKLLVAGTHIIFLPKTGKIKTYGLHKFVHKRDPQGNTLYAVIKETISRMALPPDVRSMVEEVEGAMASSASSMNAEDNVDVYTKIYLTDNGKRIASYEEVVGQVVAGTEASWPLEDSPWRVLGWNWMDDEDYARPFVENYLGDLIALDALEQLLHEGSVASGKIVGMIRDGATTEPSDVAEAENGDFITGNADDVSFLQLQKGNDLSIALRQSERLERRLAFAFQLNTAIQRDGERVTAEEIRLMAQELEESLGGIYSELGQDLQKPIVQRKMAHQTAEGKLPELPKGLVEPTIVTGLEALRRGHDANKLDRLLARVKGSPEASAEINWNDLVRRVTVSEGMDPSGLVKSPEQKQAEMEQAQAEQQQQQATDLAGKAAGPAINAMARRAEQ